MEILFISHKYPPSIGGMEKQSFELINGISSIAKVHKIVYTGEESRVSFFLKLRKRVKRKLAKNPGIQLIHLNDGLMVAATLWIKKITNIPVVATIHGLDIVFPFPIYQKYIVPKFNHLDAVIAVSKATATACIQRGIENKKVFVVNNGVDKNLSSKPIDKDIIKKIEERYNIDLQNKKILISLGRPVKRKGFSWFLKNVLNDLPTDVYYLMVGPLNPTNKFKNFIRSIIPNKVMHNIDLFLGSSSDEMALKHLLLKPKIASKSHHLGKLKYHELLSLLAAADIFVMPNISVRGDMEGFGLVALEAALSKTLVVASGIEGITDAIRDHKNGQLVRSGNRSDWINVLTELIQSPDQISVFSEQAKLFTQQNYGWQKMSKEYFKIFSVLLESKSSVKKLGLKREASKELVYKLA